jgi:hypothetical protein
MAMWVMNRPRHIRMMQPLRNRLKAFYAWSYPRDSTLGTLRWGPYPRA